MAKAKKTRRYTTAEQMDGIRRDHVHLYGRLGLIEAKLESTVMELGKANQRIYDRHREMQLKENDASCTALDRLGYRIDEQDLVITKLLTDKQPAAPVERELPEGWAIKPYTNGVFVLSFEGEGKLTTYCGRDSAVVTAWLQHLDKDSHKNVCFRSRTLADKIKVWWFTNEYGISSPDFRSLEACIRACIP